MSNEIALRDIDSGYDKLPDIGRLSDVIARTEFVPDHLRGKPAAVAACIMYGRELGLPPMTSLQNVAIIKGTPTLSARMMRALVQAAGHQIQVTETNNARCKVRGTRADNGDTLEIGWTIDDAKNAGLLKPDSNWSKYPRNMLQARATGELCRLLFADVIAGFVTPEEVEEIDRPDPDVVATVVTGEPAADVASPVAKPKQRRKPAPKRAALPAAAPDDPPLPGEEGFDQVGAETVRDAAPAQEEAARAKPSPAQVKALHAALSDAGLGTRDDKLRFCSDVVGRQIESSSDLSAEEVSACLDVLKGSTPEPPEDDGIVDAETVEDEQ